MGLKYLQFDWLINTKYFAYLKAAYFSSNLIVCQLKITYILTAAPPLFLSLLFVDVAADFWSWMFLSRIFCTKMLLSLGNYVTEKVRKTRRIFAIFFSWLDNNMFITNVQNIRDKNIQLLMSAAMSTKRSDKKSGGAAVRI